MSPKPAFNPPRSTLALAALALALGGCAGVPADALKLGPTPVANREMQTRTFDGHSESEMLAASAGVLQDLGFTLEESDSKLGLVSASRSLTSRRSLNGAEIAKDLAWTLLTPHLAGAYFLYDAATGVKEPQVVRVSLVTSAAAGAASGASVRATAQRVVYKDERHTKVTAVEPLNDPKFYEEFFSRLAKSAFLEKQKNAL